MIRFSRDSRRHLLFDDRKILQVACALATLETGAEGRSLIVRRNGIAAGGPPGRRQSGDRVELMVEFVIAPAPDDH
jgi:hypothetical protein